MPRALIENREFHAVFIFMDKEKNEETRQFEKIFEASTDPIEIQKKELKKRREEIKKDKDFII